MAQNRAAGPSELPPAGFSGQQYVDSRGCAYLRAGHGGQATWVLRIGSNRLPICGLTPTRTAMVQARAELDRAPAVAAAPAPTQARPAGGRAPMETVASTTTPPRIIAQGNAPRGSIPVASYAAPRLAAPVPTLAPAPTPAPRAVVPDAAPAQGRSAGCPANAPIAQIYDLVGGGQVMICSASNRRLSGLRPGDQPVAALGSATREYRLTTAQPVQRDLLMPSTTIPKGFRAAWDDGRLNPNRGLGTAQGAAQMRQVWTDQVPQRLVGEPKRRQAIVQPTAAQPPARVVSLSTKGQAAPRAVAAPAGARFVQVGSFGVPANASRAAQRLSAMGLPVSVLRTTLRNKPVEVVRAGPFATPAEAAALAAARRAGFNDALLRR